jgi:hypothetical protein
MLPIKLKVFTWILLICKENTLKRIERMWDQKPCRSHIVNAFKQVDRKMNNKWERSFRDPVDFMDLIECACKKRLRRIEFRYGNSTGAAGRKVRNIYVLEEVGSESEMIQTGSGDSWIEIYSGVFIKYKSSLKHVS